MAFLQKRLLSRGSSASDLLRLDFAFVMAYIAEFLVRLLAWGVRKCFTDSWPAPQDCNLLPFSTSISAALHCIRSAMLALGACRMAGLCSAGTYCSTLPLLPVRVVVYWLHLGPAHRTRQPLGDTAVRLQAARGETAAFSEHAPILKEGWRRIGAHICMHQIRLFAAARFVPPRPR